MLNYKIYLDQIGEMISRIENSTKNVSIDEFAENKELWDSTLLRLQVIGESINNIPYEIKKKNKQVRWKIFSKLRNFISHKYISVNKEIIWDIIHNQIPELKKELQGIR